MDRGLLSLLDLFSYLLPGELDPNMQESLVSGCTAHWLHSTIDWLVFASGTCLSTRIIVPRTNPWTTTYAQTITASETCAAHPTCLRFCIYMRAAVFCTSTHDATAVSPSTGGQILHVVHVKISCGTGSDWHSRFCICIHLCVSW
jgi:hypothetical protein